MAAAVDSYLFVKDLTPACQGWYVQKLEAFAEWCRTQGIVDIEGLSAMHVYGYLKHLRETPSPRYGRLVGTHTIHGHMRIIKAFLHWCLRPGATKSCLTHQCRNALMMPMWPWMVGVPTKRPYRGDGVWGR